MIAARKSGLCAIVLCGGKSLRAGFDKQTIRIDGKPIAVWIAEALLDVFDEAILVTNQPALYDSARIRIVEDILPDMGPLGGIHAGLTHCSGEGAFVTACDMPNISPAYLRLLAREASGKRGVFDAVAVRLDNGMLEPMNAIYAKRALPQIERMLVNGERKTSDLLRRLNTRFLSEGEIQPFGGREKLFFNMNTPEEIQTYFLSLQASIPKKVQAFPAVWIHSSYQGGQPDEAGTC
ncbi:MAG TPA: molybdenum cofactor guanylyltransferase [Candidatus Cryosericum sp.]|nr:molybdenum cofactor guanylyltransferase [Candidatus Cryosericum sp.]